MTLVVVAGFGGWAETVKAEALLPHSKGRAARLRRRALQGRGLAAADELDNFQAVASGYAGFFPFGLRQDFEVVFDGYAAGVESQVVEEGAHTGAGRQLFRFPVYVNVNSFGHGHIILQERGVSHAARSGGGRCSSWLPRESPAPLRRL